MSSKTYCGTYPFNPNDTYPQIMSDGRELTSYVPSKMYNCQIMQNIAKETGKPFDPRSYRQVIVSKGKGIEQVHNDCLVKKYSRMQTEMKENLHKLDAYVWN